MAGSKTRSARDGRGLSQQRAVRGLRRAVRPGDPRPGGPGAREGLPRRAQGQGLHRGAAAAAPRLRGKADAGLLRGQPHGPRRRRPDLPEEGGPAPRRGPQDQQHHRAGAPREEDGEEADNRGDRGGAARGGDRDGLRGPGPEGGGLHGHGGHREAEAERLQDEAPGRRGPSGRQRLPHPQGRDKRGAEGLGDQRQDDLLPPRLGRRASPVSRHGQGLPERDRRRGEGGVQEEGPPPGRNSRLRRRREQLDGQLPRLRPRQGRQADRRRGGRDGGGQERRLPHRREEGRAPRDAHLRPPGRERAGEEHREHLGGAGLPGRRS